MNKKELKEYWNSKTLGEIRGQYNEKLRILNNMKNILKQDSEKLASLDFEAKYYVRDAYELADSIKRYAKDIREDQKLLDIIKPILDKKELEGINQTEYEKYMNDNKANIKLLILKVKEMEQTALKEWEELPEKLIKEVHDSMLKELIWMLKDNVGNITEIIDLSYNGNRGMDGQIKGDKGIVSINTILAGGYNIQKLHYRTLIHKF